MVIRVDVVDAALQAVYGPDTDAMLASGGWPCCRRPGGPLDDARRRGARGPRAADAALRALRGHRRARHASTSRTTRSRSARTCCPGGELAAMVVADVVLRKLPGRARARARARSRSRSRRRSRAAPEYPHYTRPGVLSRAGRCRRCCSRGTTREVAGGGTRRRRSGGRPRLTASSSLTSRPPRRSRRPPPARHGGPSPMNELIQSVERRQLRQVPDVPGRRPRARPLPGRGGHPAPHPGLRGRRPEAAGQGRPPHLHGAQAVLRRGRRAHVSRALAQDRADRGDGPRRGPPREALLPARPDRPPRARAREPRLPPRGRGA